MSQLVARVDLCIVLIWRHMVDLVVACGRLHGIYSTKAMNLSDDLSEILGPDFNIFMRNGGQRWIRNAGDKEVNAIESFAAKHGMKILLSYNPGEKLLYIKRRTGPHECPGGVIAGCIGAHNATVSGGDAGWPIQGVGGKTIRMNHGKVYEPGTSFEVYGRHHHLQNMVVETRYRNFDENYVEWFDYLRDYLEETKDIMVVIGIIILRNPNDPIGYLPLVCVVFTRPTFSVNHLPDCLVSFGLQIPHQSSITPIESAAGARAAVPHRFPMQGVGFPWNDPTTRQEIHVPCNTQTRNHTLYLIRIPAHLLLRQDNEGNHFHEELGLPENFPDFHFSLFQIQRSVVEEVNEMGWIERKDVI